MNRYLRLLTFFGAAERDVPKHYRWGRVLRYTVGQSVAMTLLSPLALAGGLLWAIPYQGTRRV